MRPAALTIAGSDPSGGAGIQADLKTFHQHGVYGEAVVTLVTVQNTRSVDFAHMLEPRLVVDQIRAVVSDIPPAAAKTGALGNAAIIDAVAHEAAFFTFPLIVDPVMISKHGSPLTSSDALAVMRARLLPVTFLLTPNLHEAAALAGGIVESVADMKRAAERLHALGCKSVLVKGGHLAGHATDVLLAEGKFYEVTAERIDTVHTHGTGCTYSAAITASLANGMSLLDAVTHAKQYITRAIESNEGRGGGSGPVNHFA